MNTRIKIIFGDSRRMGEAKDSSIGLVVTSPPYWNIKDYGSEGQIGYGQTLHEYLKDLYGVWRECYRLLEPGRRLCINIGDQFARSVIFGRYKIIPLHAEFIVQCEDIGFDYMGSIIWQKKTTMNTTGGANIMGSYPYPPNGMIEIDYEYILVFKKPGDSRKIDKEIKQQSEISKDEWKQYFYGHWTFSGARQNGHEAMFPDELPHRLIKMFSFTGDTVLDPFLGSGTTVKTALNLNRNSLGYEINEQFRELIEEKIGLKDSFMSMMYEVEIIVRKEPLKSATIDYRPLIRDAEPKIEPKKMKFKKDDLYRVQEIVTSNVLKLDTGLSVKLLGIKVIDECKVRQYLSDYVLRKEVYLRYDKNTTVANDSVDAYVYLKNRIFINSYLIKSGLATVDRSIDYRMRVKFEEQERVNGKRMDT